MKELRKIIDRLSQSELKIVRDIFCNKYEKDGQKRIQLLSLIAEGNCHNDKEACIQLYGHEKTGAFHQLKKRLKEDLLDLIIALPSHTASVPMPISKEEFQCDKLILQSKFLLNRGVNDEAIKLLKKVRKLASKFEYHGFYLTATALLNKYDGHSIPEKNASSENKRVNKNLNRLEKEFLLKKVYYQANTDELLHGKFHHETHMLCFDGLASDSKNIRFLQKLFFLKNNINKNHFKGALPIYEELMHWIEQDTTLKTNENYVLIHIETARMFLCLKQYTDSVYHSLEAHKLPNTGLINELYAAQLLFFSYFRNRDYDKAAQVVAEVMKEKIEKMEVLVAQWKFFSAAIDFAQHHYRSSLKKLHVNLSQKCPAHWLPGYKLLELMNLVEMREYDWFEFRLEAFRKLLQNLDTIPSRLKASYHLFRSLLQSDFDFERVSMKNSDLLTQLKESVNDYHWNPAAMEIIKIDEWLTNKLVESHQLNLQLPVSGAFGK